jgi:pilus assembly protein CpaB
LLLRRTKTIAFNDEPDPIDDRLEAPVRPSLRRSLDALRSASLRTVPPEPLPQREDSELDDNPVHRRMDFLSSELEREPITKGSQESLQALREEFRRKHVGNDEPAQGLSLPSFSLGGLKPSRILLLLVALVAGGLAAWLAVGRAPEPTPVPEIVEPVAAPVAAPTLEVLVAKDTISPGTKLTADLLEWQKWPEETVRSEYITSAATPEAITDYTDSVARSEILAGEPIRTEKLGAAGAGFLSAILAPGARAVSVSIDAKSASGGFIVPDDHVDVVLSRLVGLEQVSRTILTNVRVLAINERFGASAESAEAATPQESMFSDVALATLELSTSQAELIINAANAGSLSLVLRPTADSMADLDAAQQTINQSIRVTSPFWVGSPPSEKTAGAEPLFPKMQQLP